MMTDMTRHFIGQQTPDETSQELGELEELEEAEER